MLTGNQVHISKHIIHNRYYTAQDDQIAKTLTVGTSVLSEERGVTGWRL